MAGRDPWGILWINQWSLPIGSPSAETVPTVITCNFLLCMGRSPLSSAAIRYPTIVVMFTTDGSIISLTENNCLRNITSCNIKEEARMYIRIFIFCSLIGYIISGLAPNTATSQYRKQCWSNSLAYIYGIRGRWVNSLAPSRWESNFKSVIFKLISQIDISSISYEIALGWIPQHLTDDKSTLVHVMAWCRQATGHYMSQCWHRYMPPCGVSRPQWVKANCQDLQDDRMFIGWWLKCLPAITSYQELLTPRNSHVALGLLPTHDRWKWL